METEAVSIRALIADKVKDDKGQFLPKEATCGEVSWFTFDAGVGKGRILESNRDMAMARNFSCGTFNALCNAQIAGGIILSLVGTSDLFGNLQTQFCRSTNINVCDGDHVGSPQAETYSWTSANPAIAAMSGSDTGQTAQVLGVAPGTTTITGKATAGRCTKTGSRPGRVISVVVNFVPPRTPGNGLSFLNASNECSESLGLQDCSGSTGYWAWNLEGNAKVYDNDANWTVLVTNQLHYVGRYIDSNSNFQPFSCSSSNPNDGPQTDYLQKPAGQTSIFYIDGPGPFHGINPTNQCFLGTSPIDNMTIVFNFQVKFTNTVAALSRTVFYYVKIVIASGRQLDRANSTANYGNISLNF